MDSRQDIDALPYGRLRELDILRAVSRICGLFVFHDRGSGIYECFYRRRQGIWALSVLGIRENHFDVSHICDSASAFSVLPAFVSVGQGAKRVLYVCPADRAVVFGAELCFFPHRIATVYLNRLVKLYIFCTINEKNELHNNVIILSKGDL